MKPSEAMRLVTEIVAAFVAHNSLPMSEVSGLLEAVHSTVAKLGNGETIAPTAIEAPGPAVSIRKSVTPDYLICLDDGKSFKSLKRHLSTLGMTPEQYRVKWNLPHNYPMVAPNYAAQRSELAKQIGLGGFAKKRRAARKATTAKMAQV